VQGLVARAHRIDDLQRARIVAPDWTRKERFDIRAVVPPGATERDVPEMLRALLVERFAMKTRVEQRPFPVYELVVAKSGPRLQEVAAANDLKTEFPGVSLDIIGGLPGDEVRTFIPRGRIGTVTVTDRTMYEKRMLPGQAWELNATRITIAELITAMQLHTDRPVVDKTGLTGIYQLKVLLPEGAISPSMRPLLAERLDSDPSGVSLSRSLQDLGLELVPRESLVDFVVVDSIERPTSN
jgi:uncharacterized protein (TIGR03435 family)